MEEHDESDTEDNLVPEKKLKVFLSFLNVHKNLKLDKYIFRNVIF